jgi:hypothetical protein
VEYKRQGWFNVKFLLFLGPLLFSLAGLTQDYKIGADGKAIALYAGQVLMIKGRVELYDQKQNPLRLSVGKKVYNGQTIKTFKASIIRIKTNDQSVLTLAPDTTFKITDFNPDEKKRKKAVFDLISGKMRAKVQKKRKQEYTFRTKTVSMGIRGTEFLMNYDNGQSSLESTQVALLSGKLRVQNLVSKKIRNMKKRELYIQNSAGEEVIKDDLRKMSDQEYAMYSRNVDDFSNDVAPFLDLSDEGSGQSQKSGTAGSNSGPGEKARGKDWKKTLKKLNNKLKKE